MNLDSGFGFNSSNGSSTPSLCTYWRGNQMEYLAKGMVLTGGGMIGPQGNTGWPIDNQWLGSWWSLSGNYGAFADNSSALNSKLTVKTGTPWAIPSPSGAVGPIGDWYSNPLTILSTTLGDYYCGSHSTNRTVSTNTFASTDSYYISNTAMFRFLFFNDSLKNTNPDLVDFYDSKKDSSYGLFMEVEDKLYSGNILEARNLNNSFNLIGANNVETNYKSYYGLYANYAENDFNPTNSADLTALINLANSCPASNGACVYQARALYSFIYQVAYIYNDNCDVGSGNRPGTQYQVQNENLENLKWNIELFPNPASNQINVIGKKESELLQITIKDLSNRTVFKTNVKTINFIANFEISLTNGLYLITVCNSRNEEVTKKIIVYKL